MVFLYQLFLLLNVRLPLFCIFSTSVYNALQTKSSSDVNLCVNEIKTVTENIAAQHSDDVLYKSINEVYKHIVHENLDSLVLKLAAQFNKLENIFL